MLDVQVSCLLCVVVRFFSLVNAYASVVLGDLGLVFLYRPTKPRDWFEETSPK